MVEDFVRRKGYLTLGSRMKRIGERLQAEVQQLIDGESVAIQSSQYPLLAVLDENGPLSVGEVAEALGVSQPGITRTVGQLVKLGAVSMGRGKQDARTKIVALTEMGQQIVQQGQRRFWPQIESCLADILAGQSGPLLEQLDILEDALRDRPLSRRVSEAGRG